MKYIELIFAVLCVVAILQALGRRLPLPMAGLQIAAGFMLSKFSPVHDMQELASLLFVVLVPPLLYAEAAQVPKRELLRAIRPILGLALGLVAITTLVVGVGLHALLPEMPLAVAFALAAALGSTDTVAVSNFVSRIPLPHRLQVLLSGESLLNDSVALVAFKVAVAAAVTAQFSADAAAVSLLTVSTGGLATGAAVALVATGLRRWMMNSGPDSVRIDTIMSLMTPYAAFMASERLGVSGVLAVVAAGLCTGALDSKHQNASTRMHSDTLWSTVTFSLGGAVFVMLGLEMRQVLKRVEGYDWPDLLGYVMLLTLTLFAVRLGWTLMLAWWSRRHPSSTGESLSHFGTLIVAVLCGVRGSLALSATLSIPFVTADNVALPGRDLAIFLAAGTIAMTLLLSSLILPFLNIRRQDEDTALVSAQHARIAIAGAALRVIESQPLTTVSIKVRAWAMALQRMYESRLATLDPARSPAGTVHRQELEQQRALSLSLLTAQRQELLRLREQGCLTHVVMRELEAELDLAELALGAMEWRGSAAS